MNGQHFVFYIPHFPKLGLTIVLEIVLTFSSFLALKKGGTHFFQAQSLKRLNNKFVFAHFRVSVNIF